MAAYQSFDDDEPPKPRNDAYTGLLLISFLAMLIACGLLFVDWFGYYGLTAPNVKASVTPVPKGGAPAKADPGKQPEKKDVKQPEPGKEPKKAVDKDPKTEADPGKDPKKEAEKDPKNDAEKGK